MVARLKTSVVGFALSRPYRVGVVEVELGVELAIVELEAFALRDEAPELGIEGDVGAIAEADVPRGLQIVEPGL